MRKRICSLLIAVVMLLTMLPMAAGASDIVDQGQLTKNIKWIVYEDGTLYVSGYGDTGFWGWYYVASNPMFTVYADQITKIRVFGKEDGIVFCDGFFSECKNATKITFNGAVNHMGMNMFPESLQEISVPDSNKYFEVEDGVLYSKNNKWTVNSEIAKWYRCGFDFDTVPDTYTLLCYPSGKTDSTYDMPSTVEGIATNAFGCGNPYLERVRISSDCSKLGKYFSSNIDSVKFPRLEKISCASNENFTSEGSVLYTKDKSEIVWFPKNYRRSHYDIPETVKEVDTSTFWYTSNLKSIFIPAQTKLTCPWSTPDASDIDFEAEHYELHFEGNAPDDFYPYFARENVTGIAVVDVYYNVNANGWENTIKDFNSAIKYGSIVFHPQGTVEKPTDPEPIDPVPSVAELTYNTYDGQMNISIVDQETIGSTIALRDEASVNFDDKRFIGWRDTDSGIDYAAGAAYTVPDHNVWLEARFESIPGTILGDDTITPPIYIGDTAEDRETEERPVQRARRKADSSSSGRKSAPEEGQEERAPEAVQTAEPQFEPAQPEAASVTQTPVFADVPAHEWYAAAADYVTSRRLMTGTSAALFSPNTPMTRAMLWTVLARADGTNTDGDTLWYGKGLAWAQSNGVSDGSNPDGMVTREQIASMLYRTVKAPAGAVSLSGYPDSGKVSDWAVEAMQWAVTSGLITGKSSGALDPQGAATRAEVAQILMRYQQSGAAQ